MKEALIIGTLLANEQYTRKVLPYLREEYFTSASDKAIFSQLVAHFNQYNRLPTPEAILIDLQDQRKLGESDFTEAEHRLQTLESGKDDMQWLMDTTEKFCKEKALYLALIESIAIADGKSKKGKSVMPEILTEALAVSFDNHIGHDYLEDAQARYDFYHKKETKIPFHIKLLNEITGGGVSRKTLNILLAGTGVGKTLVMCDMAAHHLENGYNVLYITNEMAEERIAERIDASLLDFAMDELQTIPSSTFMSRINALKKKTQGRLKIKEYPTSSASVLQFEHLLNELKIKNNFIPDIIYVDYLNICASARVKMGGSVNSYLYVKSIAEELRGFAVKHNVPIISATQTNREGFDNSDVGMTETSESFGVPMTLDLMLALISNEELDKMQQLLIKQLKNRYEDWRKKPRFVVGLERAKMKMYDLDDSAQSGLLNEHDDTPVMDRTNVGSRINDERPGNKHRRPGSNRNIETFANREL